jgi:hypothetical protein
VLYPFKYHRELEIWNISLLIEFLQLLPLFNINYQYHFWPVRSSILEVRKKENFGLKENATCALVSIPLVFFLFNSL